MPASATRHLDLRTGPPIWDRPAGALARLPRLRADLTTDVVVVGGGVTGALVADALVRADLRVAVVDRRGWAVGSTAASTALLQFEIDQPLIHLTDAIGRSRATRAYARSATAVEYLRGRIADLGLRCGFRERHAAYLPGNVLDVAGLRAEVAARDAIGLRSELIDRDRLRALTTIDRPAAIWSGGAAEVDPVALARGLWRSAIARGAQLFAPVEVTDVAPDRRGVTLATAQGYELRARHVVFATGYEVVKLVTSRRHRIVSSWVIATRPQPRTLWPSRCLIWEAADPYLYIRTSTDGRVIVGGEDADFSDEARRDALIPRKAAALAKKLAALLPGIDATPTHAWAGCFGDSSTGLPAIGRIPGARNCHVVMGFGGNGITFAAVAAQLLQRTLTGLRDPDEDLFAVP